MYGLPSTITNKHLIKVTRDFTAEQHDELSVVVGEIAQFMQKPEPYWYQVYLDGNIGKLPTSSCIEFNSYQLSCLRLIKSVHRAFVAKYNFSKSEDTDLAFGCNDILIGFHKSNDDWWYGTRLQFVSQDSESKLLSVKSTDCGIFPLNHVWQLRDDLLPDYVFNSVGVQVIENNNNNNNPVNVDSITTTTIPVIDQSTTNLHNNNNNNTNYTNSNTNHTKLSTNHETKQFQFYVKVSKTLKAELPEEIELPLEGEVLGVISVQDKLYYFGQSLDGTRKGIFPKKFVEIIANYEDDEGEDNNNNNNCDISSNSSFSASPIPPSIPPPQPPPEFHEKFNDDDSPTVEDKTNLNSNIGKDGQFTSRKMEYQHQLSDSPPSYDHAVSNCYGYVDNMFSEVSPYGRVQYDFDAQFENELTLRENQIVHLIRHLDQGWTEGELNATVGIFPTSYVTIIVDCESYVEDMSADMAVLDHDESLAGKKSTSAVNNQVEAIDYPINTKAKILTDYDGKMEQDLKVCVGDIVTLLRRFSSTNWVEAMDSSGNVGFVNLDFCQILDSEPSVLISASGGRYCNISNLKSTKIDEEPCEPPEIPKHKYLSNDSYSGDASKSGLSEKHPEKSSEHGIVNDGNYSAVKPRRRAPQAPRGGGSSSGHSGNNIFPTFNQFVHNEKTGLHDSEQTTTTTDDNLSTTKTKTSSTNISSPYIDHSSSPNEKSNDEKSHDKSRRECIITELIQTERDYCHAMNVCIRAFEITDTEAEKCNFNFTKVFGNLKAVIVVSKSLLKLLDTYANNRPFVDQRVGYCFLELKSEIEDAYTQYCRNHDSINLLLKVYEADSRSNSYIKSCLLDIQRQTNTFDISSIIIKPVQRILKYPLLLNELIKCTDPSHTDFQQLPLALQMITDIANNINEHKRRQDLIHKYCKVRDPSLGERFKSFNMHTVKKKSYRFGYRFLSSFTFSNGAKDEVYSAALEKFLLTEKTIKNFISRITNYLQHLENYFVQSLVVAEEISNYYDNKRNPQIGIDELRSAHRKIHSEYFRNFKAACERNIIGVMLKLVEKFSAPLKLIQKREDKRIDYEASIKSNKNSDSEAEKTFMAINQQLVEELPKLTEASIKIFSNCFQSFLLANKKLAGLTTMTFLELSRLPFVKNYSFAFYDDIEENFRVKHNLIFEKIVQELSLLHVDVFQSGGGHHLHHHHGTGTLTAASSTSTLNSSRTTTLTRFHSNRNSNTWKNTMPINKTQSTSGTNTNSAITITNEKNPQSESQKRSLETTFDPKDLYQVNETYEPYDLHELYVQKFDIVGVIKRQDPMGLGHRWFVDRGEKVQGFLPQNILTPYPHASSSHHHQPQQPLQQLQSENAKTLNSLATKPMTFLESQLGSNSYQNNEPQTIINTETQYSHYYDTVPGEPTGDSQPHSLLSFDEIDTLTSSTQGKTIADDIASAFDPLISGNSTVASPLLRPSSQQSNRSFNSRPDSIVSNESVDSNNSGSTTVDNYYHSIYPFHTTDPNQISLTFGQRVFVLHKSDTAGNTEWWYVQNQSGQKGYVPANYLSQLNAIK